MKLLEGKKGLVVGIANEQSIAAGCANAFHQAGAQLAVTYLSDRSKPHVEPVARAVARSARFSASRQGGMTSCQKSLKS